MSSSAARVSRHNALVRFEHDAALVLRWVSRIGGAAAVAIFLSLAVSRGLPRTDFAAQWEPASQLLALALATAGWLLAWRWEGLGGVVTLVGAVALGVLATLEYHPTVALVACLAFFVPGALSLLLWQRAHHPLALAIIAAGLAGLLVAGGTAAARVYDYYYGPTHPESTRPAYPDDIVEWTWAGATTTHGFTVKAKPAHAGGTFTLLVSNDEGLSDPMRVEGRRLVEGSNVLTFSADGLDAGTRYHYAVERDGQRDGRRGVLRTFPEGAASFVIAVGSCSRTGSNGQVYERILAEEPLLFVVSGDIQYENISTDDPAAMRWALDKNLGQPAQQALYLGTSMAYTWDDHDYGGNGSDRTSKSRAAARAVYREYVPHYELPAGEGNAPIYQAFTVGRVRFIMTDTRSERDPAATSEGPGKTMLGEAQKAWLKDELLAANGRFPLIVWVEAVPWIANEQAGADHWGGYATERQEIADFIVANGIQGLTMVSGDAHMLAIDDGSNNVFASDGKGPAFPVFHAAALDRRGKLKGGPYSSGTFGGGGQFGLITVGDRGGDTITVQWSGRNWKGEEIVAYAFTVPAPAVEAR